MPRLSRRTTENELSAVSETEHPRILDVDRALLAWSAFVLQVNPQFRSRLFGALAKEWIKHMRGVLYDEYSHHEIDRTCVEFNSEVIFAIAEITGTGPLNSAPWEPRRKAGRHALQTHFERAFDRWKVTPSSELTTDPTEVTDLNLWRQSHPRPINRCAVEV